VTAILRGLTWDHPRGYVVLEALAAGAAGTGEAGSGGVASDRVAVRWDRQSLEGFESRPLRTLADDYDLVITDHPGLGEAVGDGALLPLDMLLSADELAACAAVSAGRSFASYQLAGRQWALPIDAAAQVSVAVAPGTDDGTGDDGRSGHADLAIAHPVTWEDVGRVARRRRTAVCLGGPHALLMFSAICVALGAPPADSPATGTREPGTPQRGTPQPGTRQPGTFVDQDTGTAALEIMADLLAHADQALAWQNPIAVLDAMAADDGPVYCPLVYGYVTYQRPRPGGRPLAAFDAPAGPGGPTGPGRIGSVLGGAGIAVTRSCADLAAARALLLRLVSRDVQVGLYAELGGQSADRRAWLDPAADARAGGFYSATHRTIETAWVRPRFAGYVEFQAAASATLRDGLSNGASHKTLIDTINQRFVRNNEKRP
jgi:multiple sugar transport system substrate-binding protein